MTVCPHCGTEYERGAYCPDCGTSRPPDAATGHFPASGVPEEAAVSTLRVHDGTAAVRRVTVTDSLVVGRAEDCDLRLSDDGYASPRHARFFHHRETLCVEDLESVNGIFLRIRGPVNLLDRDRIRVGTREFRFEVVRQSEEEKREVTRAIMDPSTQVRGTRGSPCLARLVIRLEDGGRGKEYSIGRRAIVIGRGQGTHNFMSDAELSLKHAMIAPGDEGRFVLSDLNSASGTWRQVRGSVYLKPGHDLLLGTTRITVETAPTPVA